MPADGGVVDENIDPAVGGLGLLDHARHIGFLRDIAHDDFCLLPDRPDLLGYRLDLVFGRTRRDHQIGAMPGKTKRRRAADPPGGPCHQSDLAVQVLHRRCHGHGYLLPKALICHGQA